MPKGQPVSGKSNTWNDTSEKRLLLLMVSGVSISKDWDDIAARMGSTYSVSACKYVVFRITPVDRKMH